MTAPGVEVVLASAWVTKQVVFDGIVSGLVIGLVALGIVLVYRATRVINFAVGNMGLVAASLFALLVVQYHLPFWVALPVVIVAGVVFAVIVEMGVIRRLSAAPRVIVLVATIGIAQLALAAATAYPKIKRAGARYPVALGSKWQLGSLQVTGSQLSTIVVVPVIVVALSWFLGRTQLGATVQASAENPDLARVSGINPKLVSTMVWAIAGALSSISLILIAGQNGTAAELTTLGPDTLVRALAAAVIGGMRSFRKTVIAALAIGLSESLVGFNYLNEPGLIDFLILIAVLVAVWFQSRERAEEAGSFSFAAKVRPIPDRLKQFWWVRVVDRGGVVMLGLVAVILPIIVTEPSRQLLYATLLAYAICGCSLTILTGWAGQVSLGQMAFAGIGALLAATLTQGISINVGWHHTRIIDTAFTGLPFWVSIFVAAVVTTLMAVVIGIGSLRVRGLLLAITTFAFALAAEQYLYQRPILNGHAQLTELFPRGTLFGLSLNSERSYYYALLVVLVVVLSVLARLRRSGIGRTMIAVRDNPDAAAAYTVAPTRAKVQAFALAGGIAGLGGGLLSGVLQQVPFTQEFFLVNDSLVLVSLVVIGGLGSTTGPVLGAIWIVGLPAFDPSSSMVGLLTSSIGLLVLLLYFPTGLVGIAYRVRDFVIDQADKRVPAAVTVRPKAVPIRSQRRRAALSGGDVLVARDLHVSFGGVSAVDGITIRIGANEVVGLIGANGAGKSTVMNAIGGYVTSSGSVEVLGEDVSHLHPARRARLGLGRSFQAARLFPELTVRETVAVALESRSPTSLLGISAMIPRSIRSERAKRAEAGEILDFLGLGLYADHYISDLSTGTRRIVEIAGLLALSARVLCLDEPTAGVAQRETEAFGPLLLDVRRELDASMLIIEHDMPLIMGMSDRVYCLETGRVISEGLPEEVRNDRRVIASYLGTDERAIERSGPESQPHEGGAVETSPLA